MLKKYLPVALIGFCAASLTLLASLVESQAQTPEPGVNSSEIPPMTIQNGPLELEPKRGIEGLQSLLQISQPTNSPNVRQVVVPIPSNMPEESINQLPGLAAVTQFHLITEKPSSPPGPPEQSNFDVEGKKNKLPGGGILHLRVNSNKSPVTATIGVAGVKVPGYEQVRQVEFVLPQVSAP